jgi:hypothetical protein
MNAAKTIKNTKPAAKTTTEKVMDVLNNVVDLPMTDEVKTGTPNIDDVLGAHIPVFVKAAEPAAKIAKTPKVKVEKVAKEPSGPTKADKAREIFTRMAGAARQDILKAFQTEAGLTEAGSATYFANCRRAAAKTK